MSEQVEGWFAIKHGIRKHPIFRGRPERLGAWVAMLDEAAYKYTKQDVSGHVVVVRRGELCASQAMLETITGLSRQQLRTFLKALEAAETIKTRPAHKSTKSRTIITFCNYDKYQTPQPSKNQEPTKDQPTKEQINNIPVGEEASSEPVGVSILTKALWNEGVRFLVSKGVSEKNARSFIGKCRKSSDDAKILSAIEAAQKAGTEDPVPYITKALSASGGKNRFGQEETKAERIARWDRMGRASA